MTNTDKKSLVKYWLLSAQEDWKAYLALRKAKRYAQALFFLHLVIEKLLKAHIVQLTGEHAPMTHSLAYLLGKTSLVPPDRYLEYITEMSRFNMSSRYPDQKLEFYKSIDKDMSLYWHKIGLEIKKWLENSLNVN